MKLISTKIHGMLDYAFGLLLIGFPWVMGNGGTGAESIIPAVLGICTLASAMMTDYEMGVLHIIPMPTHLLLDFISGILLIVSPWLFGYYEDYLPFVIIGLVEIAVVLFSNTIRDKKKDNDNLI